jgi:pyrimidine operon attenuation protein/uracil phosphoribosyltransferase
MSKDILSIKESQQIIQLFEMRGWEIDDKNKYSLYNRYKQILLKLNLTIEEKELFLKLSRKIKLVDTNEYIKGVSKLLVKFIENYHDKNIQELYIMPSITQDKSKKDEIKSSTFISYLFTATNIYYNDVLVKKSVNIIGGYRDLNIKKNKFIKKNKPLILVDDFIGSGKQVTDSINDICSLGIKKENIFVLSLYTHEMGKQKLHNESINLIYENCITKEVSGVLNKKEIEVLKSIENKISVKPGYELGYGGSEALISLVRTPNNTLPIFHTVRKGGVNIAPFPRK